jgi:hypothetical protein
MRSSLRSALALFVGSSLVCAAFACDGDDTPAKFFDSGSTPTDAATDGADASDAAVVHAKIIAVHASPDLPAVRFCFGIGVQNDGTDGTVMAIAPTPSTPVQPGGGGPLPDLGVDLSQDAVTPYVVLASAIPANATCDALVGKDAGLSAGTDYFVLPTIHRFAIESNSTFLTALVGCLPTASDPSADITTCGQTYDTGKGNLALTMFQLDRVVANTQRFGAQIAHVSTPATGVWSALYTASTVNAVLHPLVADGGPDLVIAQGVTEGTLAPSSAASLAFPVVDQTSIIVSAVNPDGGTTPTESAIPLPLVYEATTGQATGENAYFTNGANYTFVFVGDPRQSEVLDGGAFNGYSLHLLAFPNDPTLPTQ